MYSRPTYFHHDHMRACLRKFEATFFVMDNVIVRTSIVDSSLSAVIQKIICLLNGAVNFFRLPSGVSPSFLRTAKFIDHQLGLF